MRRLLTATLRRSSASTVRRALLEEISHRTQRLRCTERDRLRVFLKLERVLEAEGLATVDEVFGHRHRRRRGLCHPGGDRDRLSLGVLSGGHHAVDEAEFACRLR